MALAIAGCERAGGETQQQEIGLAAAPVRAVQGDTMWVLLNDVKPDKREQFEHFVEQVLIPAVENLAATDEQQMTLLQQTRTLYPTEANEDGTYTYVWLMDPLVSGADYSFQGLFSRVYTAEETAQYIAMFYDALERPQYGYVVVQQRPQL
jgi:hypothetical protein